MRSILAIIAVTLATATVGYAAPMDVVNVTPPNFPGGNSQVCPSSGNSCGVVTFNSDKYVSFGEGICMPLGGNVQSIYVAHCYCTFWNKCTGHSDTDVYVDGMFMCQQPKLVKEFSKEIKYISCGGLN